MKTVRRLICLRKVILEGTGEPYCLEDIVRDKGNGTKHKEELYSIRLYCVYTTKRRRYLVFEVLPSDKNK